VNLQKLPAGREKRRGLGGRSGVRFIAVSQGKLIHTVSASNLYCLLRSPEGEVSDKMGLDEVSDEQLG